MAPAPPPCREPPTDWYVQDWLLIATALTTWADTYLAEKRAWRARQLVLRIAEYVAISEQEFANQLEHNRHP